MTIIAKDIMIQNPVSCQRYISIYDAIKIMGEDYDSKISYLVVTDEDLCLLGILSKWEIAKFMLKFNLNNENLKDIPVNNIMNIRVSSININAPLQDVIESMLSTNSECIICTEKEGNKASVKGIICKRDVLECINIVISHYENIRNAINIPAKEIMNESVKEIGICYQYEDVIDVKKRMAKNNIKHVCVVNEINDKKKLVKVISYKDIVDINSSKQISEIKTIREEKFNNEKILVACTENTKLNEIITLMIEKHVGVIPVIDNENNLIGIIGRKEIFDAFLSVLEEKNIDLNNVDFVSAKTEKTQKYETKTENIDTNKIPRFAIDIIPEGQRVICCKLDEKVGNVGALMKRNNISHIVITNDGTENGAFLGVISARDITIYRRIMNVAGSNIDETPIIHFSNPLTSKVFYCSKYTPFIDILETMVENKIGSMVVMDKGSVDVNEEIENLKNYLNTIEENISKGIKINNKFFQRIGEEYINIIIESSNQNINVSNICKGITNLLKIYTFGKCKLNEEMFLKFMNEQMEIFLSKICDEKCTSQKDVEKHIENLIDDLKKYMESVGISKEENQLKVIEEILNNEKNKFIQLFEGNIDYSTIMSFNSTVINELKDKISGYCIVNIKRKINNVLRNVYQMQLELENVKDIIEIINKALPKFFDRIDDSTIEDCRKIVTHLLYSISEGHKNVMDVPVISNKFVEILKIYADSAYNKSEEEIKIFETERKNILENFKYCLYKIHRGKIIGFISRSDVLRGIKKTLDFLQSSFIIQNIDKEDLSKILINAKTMLENKNVKEVITCHSNDKVINIDKKLCKLHIGHICVVDDKNENELIGIVSYDDFVPAINTSSFSSLLIKDVMAKKDEIFVCNKDTTLREIIDMIVKNKIGAIPVVERKITNSCTFTNPFNEIVNSINNQKRNMFFIPPIRIDETKVIIKNIDFLNHSQILQAQAYLTKLLKGMCEGEISKIILLKKMINNKNAIIGIGINKEYYKKLKIMLGINVSSNVSKQKYKNFNEILLQISKDNKIGGVIIENKGEDMFNYTYLLKGIIGKLEVFNSGLNAIKIIEDLTK